MMKWTDAGSTVAIDSFDDIEWERTEEVRQFSLPSASKDHVLEAFERMYKLPFVGFDIRFSDNTWDFTTENGLPVKTLRTFYFNPDSVYCSLTKKYVLANFLIKDLKTHVLRAYFIANKRFLEYAEKDGFIDFANIPLQEYTKYFDDIGKNISCITLRNYKLELRHFVRFYEQTIAELSDPRIMKYLISANLDEIKKAQAANKTPEIPEEFLGRMIEGLRRIMNNDRETETFRIMAAMLILYSQIGFRTGELLTVKAHSIKEVPGPEGKEPLRYIEFLSYKHGTGDTGASVAHTYINDLAYEAYTFLDWFCEVSRRRRGVDLLVVAPTQNGKFSSPSVVARRYARFAVLRAQELGFVNVADKYPELFSLTLQYVIEKYGKNWKIGYDSEPFRGMSPDDTISYPFIQMFRVTVCTQLARRGIPISFIREHMNHLSEDMTDYYVRPKKSDIQKYSEAVYSAVVGEDTKLLGGDSAFSEKVSAFIESQKMNVKNSFEDIVRTTAKNFPLRAKAGGVCTRCGDLIPCHDGDATDEIYCAFGMCPYRRFLYFFADDTYRQVQEHVAILKRNEERHFRIAAQKEHKKLQYIIEKTFPPELDELKRQMDIQGRDKVLERHPNLSYIVSHFEEISQQMKEWRTS